MQASPFGQRQYDLESDTEDESEDEGPSRALDHLLSPARDAGSESEDGAGDVFDDDALPLAPPPPPPPLPATAGGRGGRRMSKRELLDSQAAWADSSPAAGRTGKRRATQVFVNDPNMLGTIQQVRRDIEAQQATQDLDEAASAGTRHAAMDARRARLASDARDAFQQKAQRKGFGGAADQGDTEERLQELRGIFAAFDDDKDGFVNRRQLGDALYALGIIPTDSVLQMFLLQSKFSPRVDLPTFLRVAAERLRGKETVEDDIAEVFTMFDRDETGAISAGMLRHIMKDIDMPGAMNEEEVKEFFAFAGLDGMCTQGSTDPVDYTALVRGMTW